MIELATATAGKSDGRTPTTRYHAELTDRVASKRLLYPNSGRFPDGQGAAVGLWG